MIYVSPLSQIENAIERLKPSHLISLLDPETMIDTPQGFDPARHLRLGVNDIAAPIDDLVPPGAAHVQQLIEFVKGWDQSRPLLVHCWAGISRSTAAAFITLCVLNENHPEDDLARLVRACGAHAQPNKLMVGHADDILERRGRMRAAVEALGPARAAWEGQLFAIPLRPETV